MSQSLHVGIVGGGLGGLAAAVTLAARGHQVTLVERNPWLGGKAAVLRQDGFRFDMGPTILTIPSVLRRIIGEAGHQLEDRLDMVRLDPQWRCFYEDGTVLDLHQDAARMRAALQVMAAAGGTALADGYEHFMSWSRALSDLSERWFMWRSVGNIADTMKAAGGISPTYLKDLLTMGMGRTVADAVRKYVPEPRVAQMIDHFTQYVGSSPEASPAVLCGIAHMQMDEGVWYPVGGTRAVPEALERLAEELGVTLYRGTAVQVLESDKGRVRAMVLDDGRRIAVDAVISNSDSVRTHRELVDHAAAREAFARRRRYEPACSGVVLYMGLKKRYDHLLHHNFVFSRNPHEEFDAIYRLGEPAPDPTAYVCAPGISEAAVAPEGGDALYVLVHTPYLREGQDWSRLLPAVRRGILDKLARTGGMGDLEERIVTEHVLTPQDIQDRYHVLKGAIYGLASHGRFTGAFKPANRSPDLKGLYLAGGSAHPGPGMPMALMSGWIAADSLHRDMGAGKVGGSAPALTAKP